MEKEKKVEKRNVKKEEKVIKKQESRECFSRETKKTVRFLSLILSFLAIIVCIFTFVFGIITSLKVSNSSKFELLHDNFSVTFLSNINAKSIVETEDLIQGYGSKALFIVFNIIIPMIAIIAATILLIILLKNVLDFVNNINSEKELYTDESLLLIEKMACYATAIITITFVVFSRPSILLYIFVCVLLFIVISLFKKCIKNKK